MFLLHDYLTLAQRVTIGRSRWYTKFVRPKHNLEVLQWCTSIMLVDNQTRLLRSLKNVRCLIGVGNTDYIPSSVKMISLVSDFNRFDLLQHCTHVSQCSSCVTNSDIKYLTKCTEIDIPRAPVTILPTFTNLTRINIQECDVDDFTPIIDCSEIGITAKDNLVAFKSKKNQNNWMVYICTYVYKLC